MKVVLILNLNESGINFTFLIDDEQLENNISYYTAVLVS